jgi:hypothetical protein
MGSGRRVIPELLAALSAAKGEQKKSIARIVGSTKDPRVKSALQKLADSDNNDDNDVGNAGLIEFQKK